MKKSDRQLIFDKYGGRCAYCGCGLKPGWHVDHMDNVHRYKSMDTGKQEMHYPERHCIENMTPSCPSCNIYKGGCDIETFRWKLGNALPALNKRDAQYKFAKRYGLIVETQKHVVFYFETLNIPI